MGVSLRYGEVDGIVATRPCAISLMDDHMRTNPIHPAPTHRARGSIVITSHQDDLAMQRKSYGPDPLFGCQGEVTKMHDDVIGTNDLVPCTDHEMVMLIDRTRP